MDNAAAVDIVSVTLQDDVVAGVWIDITRVGKQLFGSLPTTTSDDSRGGVVMRDPGKNTFKAGEMAAVVRRGRVFVLVEEGVAADDPTYVRFASGGGGTQRGAFRNDADSGTANGIGVGLFLASGDTTNPPSVELG